MDNFGIVLGLAVIAGILTVVAMNFIEIRSEITRLCTEIRKWREEGRKS